MTATSSYVVDHSNPVNFTAPISSSVLYNQQWYASPPLDDGQHTITVKAVSVNSDAVFWFDYLEYVGSLDPNTTSQSLTPGTSNSALLSVESKSSFSTAPPAASSSYTTQQDSDTASGGPSKSAIKILTAVLVPLSVILAAVVVLLVYCGRRRKARLRQKHVIDSHPFVALRDSNYSEHPDILPLPFNSRVC